MQAFWRVFNIRWIDGDEFHGGVWSWRFDHQFFQVRTWLSFLSFCPGFLGFHYKQTTNLREGWDVSRAQVSGPLMMMMMKNDVNVSDNNHSSITPVSSFPSFLFLFNI